MQSDVSSLKLSSLDRFISQGIRELASQAIRSGVPLGFISPPRVLGSIPPDTTCASSLDEAKREHLAF